VYPSEEPIIQEVAMSVYDTIKSRASIRRYRARAIREEELKTILDSARLAQSADNKQPWEFVVIRDRSTLKAMVRMAGFQMFVGKAAVVVVCIANPSACGGVGTLASYLVDSAIATENMALTAWELGIGSCWIGAYNEIEIRKLLGVPNRLRIVSLLTLGYPDERPGIKRRKALEEIVHYERYGERRLEAAHQMPAFLQ